MIKEFPSKSPLTLGELMGALPAGATVLDLGCGPGTFNYAQFPEMRIRAIDEKIDERVKDFPSHARFTQGVASAIPARDGVFDLAIVNFAFEHFPDAVAALREVERVTRDGGCVWISMPNAGSFEDQLYRNLYSGGGHLQRPSFEWFLRRVYENTSLKLISYLELPAGFTFLGESEELRHLTWAIVDALKRTVGLDARSRSGYVFVLRKFSSAGPGFRQHLRCCYACGSPDETAIVPGGASADPGTEPWTCAVCGARNSYPSSLVIEHLDDLARTVQLQWERYPETRPERLRELVEERTRWAQELNREVTGQRETVAKLQQEMEEMRREFDRRGLWALDLDREVNAQREHVARLQAQVEQRAVEIAGLTRQLNHPFLWLRYQWRRFRASLR
jgi:SAM-dependent methyltransferase